MRCKACNAMMRVSYNRHGMEELCPRCRSMVHYEEEEVWVGDSSLTVTNSTRCRIHEEALDSLEVESDYAELDRNHESLGILDEYIE